MRILNRPMFKYGGPIKEGIMHGMKNGGKVGAFNVGSPVKGMFPKDATGREHHVGPGLLALPYIGAGVRMLARPFGSWAMKNIPKMFSGPQRKFVIGKGWQSTPGYTGNVAQNVFTPTKFGKYLAGSPEGRLLTGGAGWAGAAGKKALGAAKWVGKSPLTVGGLIWTGYQWLKPDGTPANENEIQSNFAKTKRTVGTSGAPGGGDPGMFLQPQGEQPEGPSAAELAAKAKAARTKRLNKYLDTMGYDKAKSTALADALIDASAIVQAGTDEAGSLKRADWGKMINQAIQTTSKRLDKPEQIREAVGLMMTKADIQKDMTAEENALAKLLKRKQIEKIDKDLKGNSFAENKVLTAKTVPGQPGFDAAVELTEGKNFKGNLVDSTEWTEVLKDMQDDPTSKGLNEKQLIENYVNTLVAGKGYQDGHYTVGDNLVEIKDSVVISVE